MLSSMRLAAILHRPGTSDERTWETPWTALDLATIGGARALGLERVGRVEVGWSADFAVFDISGTPFVSSHDPVTSLVLSTLSPLARHVLVAGRVVVSDGVADGVDIVRLTSKANRASEVIFGKSAERIRDIALAQQATLSNASRAAVPTRAIVEFNY
jgi:cytosine/adenosine deaminase-related metal-dependent hydrolase